MDADIESERLEQLAEARADFSDSVEETIEKQFGPGSFGLHELLDRAGLMSNNWESFIASHPATLLDPGLYRQAREIADAMADFYQKVGAADAVDVP